MNVDQLDVSGNLVATLCFLPEKSVPVSDVMLLRRNSTHHPTPRSSRNSLAEQRLGDIRELLTQARQDIERWRDGVSERSAVVVETRFPV
jgi:hypothetical protein